MNEFADADLERRLQDATSKLLPADGCDDAEMVPLKAGWSALSENLARQDAGFDAEAFARQLAVDLAPIRPVAGGRQSVSVGWRIAQVALAASLLAAVAWWGMRPPSGRDEIATSLPKHGQPSHRSSDSLSAVGEGNMDWNDPLDDDIRVVQEQLEEIHSGSGLDASLSALDRRMAELASDMEEGSL